MDVGGLNNHTSILTYGIEAQRFSFRSDIRARLRSQLDLDDRFVIGNVARLSYQKNHAFLLKVFRETVARRPDAVLLLVGRGELEQEVRRQTTELGLNEHVRFLGVRTDVVDLLNAFDVFLLPSRYEGLPVSLLEAQANGLPIFTSTAVTRETSVRDAIAYLPLEEDPDVWAKAICATGGRQEENPVIGTRFDIDVAAGLLKAKYLQYG